MRYFIANWKMNMTPGKGAQFISAFLKKYKEQRRGDKIVICPSFLALQKISDKVKRSKKIDLGSQDVFWEESGNYTGEVSTVGLKKIGVRFSIIGHSERRKFMNETDAMINKKLLSLIEVGITPILCVGETAEERKKKKTHAILTRQVQKGLKNVKKGNKLLIAYEPRWAISKKGKGEVCTVDIIERELAFIQSVIKKLGMTKKFKKIALLYGGSVSPINICSVMNVPNIDGVLVGNASLSPEKFSKIVSIC